MTSRSKVAALAAGLAGLFLASVAFGAVRGDQGRVVGTKHDVASPGDAACVVCHIQKSPEEPDLWFQDPRAGGPLDGLKALCFSCHDGTVTSTPYSYVFDPERPDHPIAPGVRGQDCDRCHDPHMSGYGKFLKLPGQANLCLDCHPRAGPANHPVDVRGSAPGFAPVDSHWDPWAGDFVGTRLWDEEGSGPGDLVKCLTCHSPHGGQPGTGINTVPFQGSAGASSWSLCAGCHKSVWGE